MFQQQPQQPYHEPSSGSWLGLAPGRLVYRLVKRLEAAPRPAAEMAWAMLAAGPAPVNEADAEARLRTVLDVLRTREPVR